VAENLGLSLVFCVRFLKKYKKMEEKFSVLPKNNEKKKKEKVCGHVF